jgi:hypothetical protein
MERTSKCDMKGIAAIVAIPTLILVSCDRKEVATYEARTPFRSIQ